MEKSITGSPEMPVVPRLCCSNTLHRALIKQSYLESIILGLSLPRNMVVD